jgi:broad specificity phosphatase PhoE
MLRRSRAFLSLSTNDMVLTPGVVLPKRLLLIRHGQSIGNIDETEFTRTPDWRIPLTERGEQQASECGRRLCELIRDEPVALYYSPYLRARQTTEHIRDVLQRNQTRVLSEREDSRLREQDMGNLQMSVSEMDRVWEHRDDFGRLFFRFPHGESGADASDRAASFIESFFRERQISSYPDDTNVIIVTHGLLVRLFVYRWFHIQTELFEQMKNPNNCQIVALERYVQRSTGKRRMRLCAESHRTLNIPHGVVLDSRYKSVLPTPTRNPPTPLHVLHGRKPRNVHHSVHPDTD